MEIHLPPLHCLTHLKLVLLLFWNQWIHFQSESMDWFPYDESTYTTDINK